MKVRASSAGRAGTGRDIGGRSPFSLPLAAGLRPVLRPARQCSTVCAVVPASHQLASHTTDLLSPCIRIQTMQYFHAMSAAFEIH